MPMMRRTSLSQPQLTSTQRLFTSSTLLRYACAWPPLRSVLNVPCCNREIALLTCSLVVSQCGGKTCLMTLSSSQLRFNLLDCEWC